MVKYVNALKCADGTHPVRQNVYGLTFLVLVQHSLTYEVYLKSTGMVRYLNGKMGYKCALAHSEARREASPSVKYI